MSSKPIDQKILSFIENLEASDHIVFFYDDLQAKENILFRFISNALSDKRAAFYICSEEHLEAIREKMQIYGIRVAENEKADLLSLRHYDGWYLQEGQVDVMRILSVWRRLIDSYQKRELELRVVGEMACFFTHRKVKDLLRYEYALHRVLDFPMVAICAYNINTVVETGFSEVIMPLVRAHGKALFAGPRGVTIFEPDEVEDYDIEAFLEIKL